MASIYDKNKLDARKRQLDFVNKATATDTSISFDEMTKFILSLVHENPYIDINNPPEVQFVEMPDGVHASYTYGLHLLKVSTKYIEKCCKDKKLGICEMTKTIGHELRHSRQYQIDEIARANPNYTCEAGDIPKNVLRALRGVRLSAEQVEKAFTILGPSMNEEYLKEVNDLPDFKKELLMKQISFGLYADQQHERDARFGGIEFAKTMLKSWKDDPEANYSVQGMCISALNTFIPDAINVENVETNSMLRYKKFESIIRQIPIEKMAELENLVDNINNDERTLTSQDSYTIIAYSDKTILKNKSMEELFDILVFALDNNRPYLLSHVVDTIDKNCVADPQARRDAQDNLNKLLSDENTSLLFYEDLALLSKLFNQEQIAVTIEVLISEGDFLSAGKVLQTYNQKNSNQENDKIIKVLIDSKDLVNDAFCDCYRKVEETTSIIDLYSLEEIYIGLNIFVDQCRNILLNRNYDYMKFLEYSKKLGQLINDKFDKFKDDSCFEQDEEND